MLKFYLAKFSMPITRSAKKALRQNKKRRAHNLVIKTHYKSEVKALKKLVTEKKLEEAKNQLSKVYQALDKSAKTNVIEKNTASRLKSRLTRLVNKASV